MPKRWIYLAAAILSLGGGLLAYAASISNGAPAFDVLGQTDDSLTAPGPVFTKSTADNGPNILGVGFGAGGGIAFDSTHHRLFLANIDRVLVFNLTNGNKLDDH